METKKFVLSRVEESTGTIEQIKIDKIARLAADNTNQAQQAEESSVVW